MPMPKKKVGEKDADFVSRFMGDPTMKKEYPDNKQRLAIAYAQLKKKENFFHVGGIVVSEAFVSLGKELRTAVKTAYGKDAWVHDYSNKEAIIYSEAWKPEMYRKVGYSLVKGKAVLDLGTEKAVRQITSYEARLPSAAIVELAEMACDIRTKRG